MPSFVLTTVSLAILALLPGCAVNSEIAEGGISQQNSVAQRATIPATTRVLVLTPKVSYEDALTEAPIDAGADGLALANAMIEQAIFTLKTDGLGNISSTDQAEFSAEQKSQAHQASSSAEHLIGGHPDAATLQLIKELGAPGESVAVLVQFLRIKRGPSGWWNPSSGAIASNASSSQFHAALLDCQTGSILWQNSIELHREAKPGSEFAQALSMLYSTINPQIQKTK